ncbi:MAG TPA: PQQ-dependent sugar dehydrogenase [Stellaceae bacterium]|nr:PQQ-dependent sugar dehydrogenase [Stellaceae bacterium]
MAIGHEHPARQGIVRILWVAVASIFIASDAPRAAGFDQEVGQEFAISPADLPAPAEDRSVANPATSVDRPPGALPRVPEGFAVSVFADGLDNARYLEVAPNGDILLAEMYAGRVVVLRDETGKGVATKRFVFADGLAYPHGIAFHDGYAHIGDTRAVWRYRWNPADGTAGPPEQVTAPGALGTPGGHITRNIAFAPDGKHFYVAIGSRGNAGEEPEPDASIREFDAEGGAGRTFASGLRNPVGIRFYPGTDTLWTVVNERDGLGDGLVPDYLTHIVAGGFYGWPYSYIGRNPQPGSLGREHPELVARAIVPDLLFQSHSAPLGLVFYEGTQFPAEYRGDAFVSLHGSWNSGVPTGYKIVRVRFRDGRPVGSYENFLTGFWLKGTNPAQVWGRPVGLAVAPDGSLLFADDVGNRVWRVSWVGK